MLKAMMERIMGESPYKSPTDMGVNMAGFGIVDDEACREASKMEIVRRYFQSAVKVKRTGLGQEEVDRLELIMHKVGIDADYCPARAAALAKAEETGAPAGALLLQDGTIVTGKTSALLGAASSLLINAAKKAAGVPHETWVIEDSALEPICGLKTGILGARNPRLHPGEMLIALSISSLDNPLADEVIKGTKELRGCDAFFSSIIPESDERLYKTLGINVSCEPCYESGRRVLR